MARTWAVLPGCPAVAAPPSGPGRVSALSWASGPGWVSALSWVSAPRVVLLPGGVAGREGRVAGRGGVVGLAGGLGADAVVCHARGDQALDRGGVDVGDDHRDDHRVAGHSPGRGAVQPGAAVAGADRGGGRCPAHRARYAAIHLFCSAESPSISRSSAK
jgi:hypothetical protein